MASPSAPCAGVGHASFDRFVDRQGRTVHIDRWSGRRIRGRARDVTTCPIGSTQPDFERYFGAFTETWTPAALGDRALLLPAFHMVGADDGDAAVLCFPWMAHLLVVPHRSTKVCVGCVAVRLYSAVPHLDVAVDEYAHRAYERSGEPTDRIDAARADAILPAGWDRWTSAVANAADPTYARWSAARGWELRRLLPVPGPHVEHQVWAKALLSASAGGRGD